MVRFIWPECEQSIYDHSSSWEWIDETVHEYNIGDFFSWNDWCDTGPSKGEMKKL